MSIGVAIIGGGIFAKEEHVPAVEACKELSLKAIYSRSLKSAQSTVPDASTVDLYSDDSGEGKGFKDLLERSDIHAVIIALTIIHQPAYIRAALSAGKHVISEKPIAENLHDAQELLAFYRKSIDTTKVTWSVAENFRYLNSFDHAAAEVQKLGRVLNFRVKVYMFVKIGSKYFETHWRKKPSHQGGFLLDGGVHFLAGLRLLLGPSNLISTLSAHTTMLQSHLPPVDTVDATMKTTSGVTGTFSLSFGTTLTGSEWTVACEGGVVGVSNGVVTTVIDGQETKEEVKDERSGVPPEIRAWGEGIAKGSQGPRQRPEEALADLELLERMLRSGEKGGVPMQCELQI